MLANDRQSASQRPPPKAVNIVRPSSPFVPHFNLRHHQRTHHDSPLISRPTVLGPANIFSLYATQHAPGFGTGPIALPQHLLQRAGANLSRHSISSSHEDIDDARYVEDEIDSIDGNDSEKEEEDAVDDDDDDDDDDGMSSNSSDDDHEIGVDDRPDYPIPAHDSAYRDDTDDVSPSKIVARIKNGTIMNGRGEFVNKRGDDDGCADDAGWLDEARANRKIADLEIEKTSLLAVNTTLEATLRQQEARITELEKQLFVTGDDGPPPSPSPERPPMAVDEELTEKLSNEAVENDEIFQRLRRTLQGLIEEAESALVQKANISAKVLAEYARQEENEVKRLAIRRSWTPSTNTAIMNRQHQRPLRSPSNTRQTPSASPPNTRSPTKPVINHTKASMARTLSRSSSPALMVSPPSSPKQPRNERRLSRVASSRRSVASQVEAAPRWR